VYDLFSVNPTDTTHSALRERFKDELIFLEAVDAVLGITGASTESDRKRAKYRADGFFIEDGKLWRLGGSSPARAVPRRECVSKLEATQLAREEHEKLHMHRDHIRTQLLDRICSPNLDASICTAILECGRCKNFGNMHVHALLAPVTRRRPFELLVGDYLSMPTGRGGYTKIGLFADVFTRKLWAFKSKSAAGKNTVDSLRRIYQALIAPETFMADGGSHFNCKEVRDYCASIGTKLHIVAAYAPWLNGLLERSNGILLNTLKRLCAPGLGEDDYESMAKKDIPSSWPEHLDTAVKNLSDRILPSLKFSPNELLLGLPLNAGHTSSPEDIELPTEEEIAVHMALAEQRWLDGYAATVDHAAKRKSAFDKKLLQRAPRNVVFQPGDLVQVHATEWVHTFASIKKLTPMWSVLHRIVNRQRNSYTLETLDGVALPGLYNTRRLRAFEPRDGTRLAEEEMARLEKHADDGGVDELEEDDSVTL
jgi:transposase InsO family protein